MTFEVKTEGVLIDSVGDTLTLRVEPRDTDRDASLVLYVKESSYYVTPSDLRELANWLYDEAVDPND